MMSLIEDAIGQINAEVAYPASQGYDSGGATETGIDLPIADTFTDNKIFVCLDE